MSYILTVAFRLFLQIYFSLYININKSLLKHFNEKVIIHKFLHVINIKTYVENYDKAHVFKYVIYNLQRSS
jgi:hypothetical protein